MGDPMGRHTTTVSTSVHSMHDPDTLSSVSIDSLRAHLHLINQKIDNVQKEFIKLKEGVREGNDNIDGSPFVLEGCYCRFHRDYGHDTEECYDLKNQIEDLIRRDHPNWYVRKPREPPLHPKGRIEKHINIIVRGPATSNDCSSTQKAYVQTEMQKRLKQ
ncbi:hypothetical protein BHE74_00013197 [Ensete ventricosum]|nr:hypothetical protein BHE74_00013197 [Ensete ventricosum]